MITARFVRRLACAFALTGIGAVAWATREHFARADGPVEPDDPDAILCQCEPSPDGRWLALSLDRQEFEGDQTLYLFDIARSEFHALGEGRFANITWGPDGMLRAIERGESVDQARWIDPVTRKVERVAQIKDSIALGLSERCRASESPLTTALRELAQHESPREMIQMSPSGKLAFVSQKILGGRGRSSFRVVDATDAHTVAGPWDAWYMSWRNWRGDDDERWIVWSHENSAELLDLESARSVPIGDGSWLGNVRWLDERRLLICSGNGCRQSCAEIRDADGRVTQRIFPPQK